MDYEDILLSLSCELSVEHGIDVIFVQEGDELYEANGVDVYLNRSASAGGNYIEIGIYDDPEIKLLSFFHEMGHCLDNIYAASIYEAEERAWRIGYELADKHGIIFSKKAIEWGLEQLSTYNTDENRHAICHLCMRELPKSERSRHHLIPKLKGGSKGETVDLHYICHSKIHSVLREVELANSYNTIQLLKAHPDIELFIKWVSKKDPSYRDSNKKSNKKKSTR